MWSQIVQYEALKIWGYALLVSLVHGLYELYTPPYLVGPVASQQEVNIPTSKNEGTALKINAQTQRNQPATDILRSTTYKGLVADTSDLVIAAHIVGWISAEPVVVGVAGSVNGLLGMHSAWERVNKSIK